jgi:L-asparaginase type II
MSRTILVLLFLALLMGTPVTAVTAEPAGSVAHPGLPHVHILATGGTIAGTADSATDTVHYKPGEIGITTLIGSVPEIRQYAEVTGEQVCNINSDDITPAIWLNLSERANAVLADPGVDGIVVTHGTDTLEETAYFLNLAVRQEKPVVITGSMRPSTAISADGPLNLLTAVQLAGSPDARGRGVLISLNGEINGARDTTKTGTQVVQTFRSPDLGLFGYMEDGHPLFYRSSTRNHTVSSEFNLTGLTTLPRVDIVMTYPGMDSTAITALTSHSEGLVIAGMGNGEYPFVIQPALEAAAAKGIPVVIASRTGSGITSLKVSRFIAADTLTPQKARILLMLALTKTHDRDRIAGMFRQY